jgi:aquaporin Z
MSKKYIAEFVGTFALSFVVLSALASTDVLPLAVPVIAGLTLALFVYTIGSISGCHINPAVTLGLLSINKIDLKEAFAYIVAQVLGAVLAIAVAKNLMLTASAGVSTDFSGPEFFTEALGAFFFAFGISAVVYGKAKEQMSGLVIGGSLLLGVLIASLGGSAGILNPAVAIALNSATFVYLIAPILGAVLGFKTYRYLAEQN